MNTTTTLLRYAVRPETLAEIMPGADRAHLRADLRRRLRDPRGITVADLAFLARWAAPTLIDRRIGTMLKESAIAALQDAGLQPQPRPRDEAGYLTGESRRYILPKGA